MTIRVVIVSDVCLYRKGLERALGEDNRLEVAGTAASPDETRVTVVDTKPDVVLLDITMDPHCTLIRQILALAPGTKIVALTVPEVATEVVACAEAGVSGYVTRDSSLEELIQRVEATILGELQCSPQIAGCLLRRLRALAADPREPLSPTGLSDRELHILDLIEKGFSNKEIAHAFKIEIATVKNHVHNILQKLHVSRRGEAAALRRHHPVRID